jgi:hypothetical protein
LGIEWDRLFAHVVQIEQAAVCQVLGIAKVSGMRDVVPNMEFVPEHQTILPNKSGRKSARRTCPFVCRSKAWASSGLGTERPLVSRLIQVLLMPTFRANSTLAPRGLLRKNSSSVIVVLSVLV